MNPTGPLRAWLGLDREVTRKALSLALAAWLSFTVAALLHVHNAYWAAMPVWVLTQPSRGAVLERGLFRVLGTLIGAAAGFALMQIPAPPLVLLALLSLWLAGNAALTHLLRGVHGYGALLAGMTAAVVVIPSLLTTTDTLGTAMSRVECTLIGVVVSSLVLSVLTPVAPLAEFYAQIRALSADAVAYAADTLRARHGRDDGAEERRILALISKLESNARLNAAGSVEGYRRLSQVDLLVVGTLSTMAAAQALRDTPPHPAAVAQLDRIAAHLRRDFTILPDEDARLISPDGDPDLDRLADAVAGILEADRALDASTDASRTPKSATRLLAPHREWSLAWQTGATAGLCAFAASATALSLGWPMLSLAALGVCIFVMVLGSLPLPQLIAPKLMGGVLAGVAVATFYRLAIQPQIDSTAGLLFSLAPFLILGGFVRALPRTGIAGIDANMCFMLASQAGNPPAANTALVLSDSLALALTAIVMAGGFLLIPRRAHRQAFDAAATIRRDLQRILDADLHRRPGDWEARAARQILRLTLHLGRASDFAERWPNGLLATLNLGLVLSELKGTEMPPSAEELLRAMLSGRASPRETAEALRTLAHVAPPGSQRNALVRLASTLDQAGELLSFDPRTTTQRS